MGDVKKGLSGFGLSAGKAGLDFVSGVGSSLINNLFARRNAELQYELNERAAENAYGRQLDFWEKQNEYNSPVEQAKRLRAAGIHPISAGLSSGEGANLSSVATGNDSSVYSPQMKAPEFDLLSAVKTLGELDNMRAEGGMFTAQTARLFGLAYLDSIEAQLKESGNDKLAEEIGLLRAQIANVEQDTESKRLHNIYYPRITNSQISLNRSLSGMYDSSAANQKSQSVYQNLVNDKFRKYGLTPTSSSAGLALAFGTSIINALGGEDNVTPDTVYEKVTNLIKTQFNGSVLGFLWNKGKQLDSWLVKEFNITKEKANEIVAQIENAIAYSTVYSPNYPVNSFSHSRTLVKTR